MVAAQTYFKFSAGADPRYLQISDPNGLMAVRASIYSAQPSEAAVSVGLPQVPQNGSGGHRCGNDPKLDDLP